MLFRHLGAGDSQAQTMWQELAEGAPTIIGFANLCASSMDRPIPDAKHLSDEAKTILAVAVDRGVMEIRANREPIDSSERLLAVCVEVAEDLHLFFLQRDQPERTIRFLNGFRELCIHGLVMHQLQREFSLTANGYELARQLNRDDFNDWIQFAVELPH